MHMALCMYACLQLCLPLSASPPPPPPPLAHSNRMPQHMYASVPAYCQAWPNT